MRGEFVLSQLECAKSIPLFMDSTADQPTRRNVSETSFNLRNASPPRCNLASKIKYNVSSGFSQSTCSIETIDFSIEELKELVLSSLEKLLLSEYYKMYLLPTNSRSPIFVPMIEAVDNLLVIGVLSDEKDLQRLLHLLDPEIYHGNGS